MPTNHPDDRERSRDDEWLTVAEAAHIEGVSSRAIQRRAAAGKYQAQRIETPKGEQWEINAATLKRSPTQQRDDKADDADANRDPKRDDTDAPTKASGNVATPPDFAARYIAQIEDENRFLKLQIEEGNRNAGELRAALRKALEAQPRQLTSGQESPTEAPRTPETLPAVVSPVEREKAPQIGSNRGEGLRQMRNGIRQILGRRK
jgi:hypothetical protein